MENDPVYTIYWGPKDVRPEPIVMPPDLTGVDSEKPLAIGDLFYYRTSGGYKLWLWSVLDGKPFWKPVKYGYIREDGRRLIVTPSTHVPSWVSLERYNRLDHGMSARSRASLC